MIDRVAKSKVNMRCYRMRGIPGRDGDDRVDRAKVQGCDSRAEKCFNGFAYCGSA